MAPPTGQIVRWAASEATGWRDPPDSPARLTPCGVDPNLGVWVSPHHSATLFDLRVAPETNLSLLIKISLMADLGSSS